MRPIIFPLLMWLCIVAGVITLLLASGCAAPETFQGVCALKHTGTGENGVAYFLTYCGAK